jgi:hypothetical protein
MPCGRGARVLKCASPRLERFDDCSAAPSQKLYRGPRSIVWMASIRTFARAERTTAFTCPPNEASQRLDSFALIVVPVFIAQPADPGNATSLPMRGRIRTIAPGSTLDFASCRLVGNPSVERATHGNSLLPLQTGCGQSLRHVRRSAPMSRRGPPRSRGFVPPYNIVDAIANARHSTEVKLKRRLHRTDACPSLAVRSDDHGARVRDGAHSSL